MSKVEPSSLRFAAPRGGRTRAGEWPAAQFVLTLNSQLSTINYDFTLVLFLNRPPAFHSVGGAPVPTPLAEGPRNWGQFASEASAAKAAKAIRKIVQRFMDTLRGCGSQ